MMKGVFEIAAVVVIMAFTITVIVPCIFAARTDDEELLGKVQQILEDFCKDTLRPLCIVVAGVISVVYLLLNWR